jgi:Pyruvate:ferredoxin oxidoreductase and related 2-oxoacid:ferredoxin oxidoreductases, beta subunit
MAIVYQRPKALTDMEFHYCPGCNHGIVHRLVAEVIDELGIEGKTIGIAPVGCAVKAYDYFACDMVEAAHGRAPAIATGIKRTIPDSVVSPIRATATWRQSACAKRFTPRREAKT